MVCPSNFAVRFEAEQRAFVCIHMSIRDSTVGHILVVHGRNHVASRVNRDVAAEVITVPYLALQVGRKLFAWRESAARCDPARGYPDVMDQSVELLEHLGVGSPESLTHQQIPGYAMGVQDERLQPSTLCATRNCSD